MKTMPHPDDLSVLLLDADGSLAVEDSVPGARSAVAAGIATVGNLTFVPAEERAKRRQDLYDAGVLALVESWADVAAMVLEAAPVVAERRS
jgi:beta-phosphoglucomutase-like phosphatase (HAD superfamily)